MKEEKRNESVIERASSASFLIRSPLPLGRCCTPLCSPHLQVARKKSKRQKRAAKKAEEDFLYKVIL